MSTRKKKLSVVLWITATIVIFWTVLTLVVQRKGPAKLLEFGDDSHTKKALVVYNPDVFYNLDEQFCKAFASGLAEHEWYAKVATIAAAEKLEDQIFDMYLFCANTYNWAPDWPTENFIKDHSGLKGKNVVAITLGSGSTARARQLLEKTILQADAQLVSSQEFWLMRPNDEAGNTAPNVKIVQLKAKALGKRLAQSLAHN